MAVACFGLQASAQQAASPNGLITADVKNGGITVSYNQQQVLDIPAVGFEGGTALQALCFGRTPSESYTMLGGKRLQCSNEANEYVSPLGENTRLVMRLYNDGIAFRYEFTDLKDATLPKELTTYRITEGTRRWMQQWTDSYEGFFPLTTSYKTLPVRNYSGITKSADGWNIRWGYPALLEPADGVFALISEANIEHSQSASCLYNDGELFKVTPAENPLHISGNWHTPWRTTIIGTLATVVESTLITDVSEPSQLSDTEWIRPGVVSWIYWAYNHGSNDYNIIKKYVDMAVRLHLPYVLIDAEWDEMKDGKTIEDAVSYAAPSAGTTPAWAG